MWFPVTVLLTLLIPVMGRKSQGDAMASTKLSRLKSLLDSVACLSDFRFFRVIKKLIISGTMFLVAVR